LSGIVSAEDFYDDEHLAQQDNTSSCCCAERWDLIEEEKSKHNSINRFERAYNARCLSFDGSHSFDEKSVRNGRANGSQYDEKENLSS
jgi:hypothetical protein